MNQASSFPGVLEQLLKYVKSLQDEAKPQLQRAHFTPISPPGCGTRDRQQLA